MQRQSWADAPPQPHAFKRHDDRRARVRVLADAFALSAGGETLASSAGVVSPGVSTPAVCATTVAARRVGTPRDARRAGAAACSGGLRRFPACAVTSVSEAARAQSVNTSRRAHRQCRKRAQCVAAPAGNKCRRQRQRLQSAHVGSFALAPLTNVPRITHRAKSQRMSWMHACGRRGPAHGGRQAPRHLGLRGPTTDSGSRATRRLAARCDVT